jgi:DUF1680 family protein
VGGYIYSHGDHDAWVHLYVQGEGTLQVGDEQVIVRQTTDYPWAGDVRVTLDLASPATFQLHLRIPGWCQQYGLSVNDFPVGDSQMPADGYAHIARKWSPGDVVRLSLQMPVQFVQANPLVHQTLGRVALQRGPIVYCLEGVDHDHVRLDSIVVRGDVPANNIFRSEWSPALLGGVTVLRGSGVTTPGDTDWTNQLYRFKASQYEPVELTAIPYYAWDNRTPGEMRVWLRTG